MSKRQLLCLLGVWIMIFLFLGLPSTWHKVIALLSGIAIITIAYNLPPPEDAKKEGDEMKTQNTFIENK